MTIFNLIRQNISNASKREKKKIKKNYIQLIKKEIKELDKFMVELIEAEFLNIREVDEFKVVEEDKVCMKYKLPTTGYKKIEIFLSQSYLFATMRDIFLLKELYVLHSEMFSINDKELLLKILTSSKDYCSFLVDISLCKNIKILNTELQNIKDDKELLDKFDELIFND